MVNADNSFEWSMGGGGGHQSKYWKWNDSVGKKSAGNDVREIPRTLGNSPEYIWNMMQMPNNIWWTYWILDIYKPTPKQSSINQSNAWQMLLQVKIAKRMIHGGGSQCNHRLNSAFIMSAFVHLIQFQITLLVVITLKRKCFLSILPFDVGLLNCEKKQWFSWGPSVPLQGKRVC